MMIRGDRTRAGAGRRLAGWISALVVVAACGGPAPSPDVSGSSTPPAPASVTPTAVTSAPPSVAPSDPCPATAELAPGGAGLPEREGAGSGATLWALFFPTGPRIVAGTEIKVAWRMTGTGVFSITATGPAGATVQPVWGPEGHGGSTWTRPGDEWGTGWVFPTPGCWTFTARRPGSTGTLSILVAPAATSATG